MTDNHAKTCCKDSRVFKLQIGVDYDWPPASVVFKLNYSYESMNQQALNAEANMPCITMSRRTALPKGYT